MQKYLLGYLRYYVVKLYKSISILTSVGLLLLCSASAHAEYCRDIENVNISPSTPTSNFIVHNDGTITDLTTNLMWHQCPLGDSLSHGVCTENEDRAFNFYSWEDALRRAEDNDLAGYNDWRLPNIKELYSIVEQRCWNPALNNHIFPVENNGLQYYWSSTPVLGTRFAYYLNFSSLGSDFSYKSVELRVRLVRDTK